MYGVNIKIIGLWNIFYAV